MTSDQQQYTSLTNASATQQPQPPTSPPQRYADWISYAVAVTQQATPAAADFTSESEF